MISDISKYMKNEMFGSNITKKSRFYDRPFCDIKIGIIEEKNSVKADFTTPAKGLFLIGVNYPEFVWTP